MSYPLWFAKDVVFDFLGMYARGWAYISQVFYLRQKHIEILFAYDQNCWNEFKRQVKYYDHVLENVSTRKFPCGGSVIPDRLKRLWNLIRHQNLDFGDGMDYLTYPLHQPFPKKVEKLD